MTELNTGKHDRGVDNQKREKRECRSSQWRTSESAIAIGGVGSVDHSSITTSRTRYEAEAQCGWSADEQVEIREHRDRHGRRHGESRFICHDPLVKPLKLPCVFLLLVPTAPYLFLPLPQRGFRHVLVVGPAPRQWPGLSER